MTELYLRCGVGVHSKSIYWSLLKKYVHCINIYCCILVQLSTDQLTKLGVKAFLSDKSVLYITNICSAPSCIKPELCTRESRKCLLPLPLSTCPSSLLLKWFLSKTSFLFVYRTVNWTRMPINSLECQKTPRIFFNPESRYWKKKIHSSR